MTFANGFFVAGADGVVPPPTLNVRVTSCDYDAVSLILPSAPSVMARRRCGSAR